MKKLSLQWRLTLITTLFIAIICGCLTMFVYGSGVYYMDSLQETVDAQNTDGDDSHQNEIYISIPDDKWDDFANDFSVQVYNNKADYKKKSLFFSIFLAILGGVATYYFSGRSLKPLKEFSEKIEEVEARNLSDSRIEENKVKELNQLSISYNKMLDRLSESFEMQRQFTANAAHELRTPLAVIQTNLEVFARREAPALKDYQEIFAMLQEQTGRLSHLAEILLDMTGVQTVERSERISLAALTDEVFCDLASVAEQKDVELIQQEGDCIITGSYLLLYRAVYNLVENAIKYNHSGGKVTVNIHLSEEITDTSTSVNYVFLEVSDTGIGIPPEYQEKIFTPFFRVDKSRSRAMGGAGLGLALVSEIVRQHNGQVKVLESSKKGSMIAIMLPV